MAARFESAGVLENFAARIIGHQVDTMTYGLYSGEIDWDKAVEAMSKVDYYRAIKKAPKGLTVIKLQKVIHKTIQKTSHPQVNMAFMSRVQGFGHFWAQLDTEPSY